MTQKVLDMMRKIEFYIKRNYSNDAKLIGLVGEINKYIKSGNQQRWVPVNERLPEVKEKVLVTHRSGVAIASLYDSESQIWIANGGKPHRLKTVTAWQKLPERYRKEK